MSAPAEGASLWTDRRMATSKQQGRLGYDYELQQPLRGCSFFYKRCDLEKRLGTAKLVSWQRDKYIGAKNRVRVEVVNEPEWVWDAARYVPSVHVRRILM